MTGGGTYQRELRLGALQELQGWTGCVEEAPGYLEGGLGFKMSGRRVLRRGEEERAGNGGGMAQSRKWWRVNRGAGKERTARCCLLRKRGGDRERRRGASMRRRGRRAKEEANGAKKRPEPSLPQVRECQVTEHDVKIRIRGMVPFAEQLRRVEQAGVAIKLRGFSEGRLRRK